MAAATASQPKKMAYEFTIDDEELEEDQKTSIDQGTMCNIYKINLPASASILSKQIAKSQAKRAKKVDRTRQRKDLSVVREEHSEENSLNASPRPATASEDVDVVTSAPASQHGGRSRLDAAPVKIQRQASLPDEQRREVEPMDDEEAELLAILLRGIERNEQRNALNLNASVAGNQQIQNPQNHPPSYIQNIPPSPGLPRLPPGAKVSEWLLERSSSPDNLSVVSSVLLEDSGLVLNYQNSDDDEEDIFFDAQEEKEEKVVDIVNSNVVVDGLEHEMQGLSLNRNMTAMTQSLVRVEEETTTTDGGGHAGYDTMNGGRTGRSTSVSPRPSTNNEQFMRNSNGSATFNVKHSSTLARLQKFTPSSQQQQINGNSTPYETPLSSRTTRSVLRVHNVNSTPRPQKQNSTAMMSKSSVVTTTTTTRRAISGIRMPSSFSTAAANNTSQKSVPPTVTINPSTPSRPASVASSIGTRSGVNMTSGTASNIEGLQDLIQMQEEALRRAAQGGQETERKMSWHSDQDANRQSTSTHSSLGSLCSSKSIDGAHALNKLGGGAGGAPGTSRIPTPRSRLPTPRGSTLPKRVHSVAAAARFATSKPESAAAAHSSNHDADECF
ncbi:hypothetical protein GCK72_011845 [Caenorhabditis remanei]|uniref:Uncharacterized protein n=1 Tax=Caenorhabditis remanei TaxID=31234 RepID=A0A6A5H770_CAERE|nr:hypothetical protein GCK72_011845 [Caenorhabditis remanei]KAF1763578.1 hypothetical protein GCK72_011845 [Caenorhabditis remanei]